MAHSVAQEFVVVVRGLADEEGSVAATRPDMRRRALLQHLNEGGHYHAMKEKLKRSVVRIVRERFHKTRDDSGAYPGFVVSTGTGLLTACPLLWNHNPQQT